MVVVVVMRFLGRRAAAPLRRRRAAAAVGGAVVLAARAAGLARDPDAEVAGVGRGDGDVVVEERLDAGFREAEEAGDLLGLLLLCVWREWEWWW